jgi:hypothetical protein
MTTDEKHPKRERNRTEDSENGSADPTVGTEMAQTGGSEPARRQAERDWQNSSKESGE